MTTDFTKLSLSQMRAEAEAIARETQTVFGHLNERQLNWRPSAEQWSVAQCFEHLLKANGEMLAASDAACGVDHRPTFWQRLPVLPWVFGWLLIKSQSPDAKQKFKAPPNARPAASAIDPQIISRFIEQQRDLSVRIQALEKDDAARIIMTSPFVKVATYSVLDGCRLIVAHERRHFEQARRVTQVPGFPT